MGAIVTGKGCLANIRLLQALGDSSPEPVSLTMLLLQHVGRGSP